jgi:hypothetical protein
MTIEERRIQLHEKLCSILGSRNVYYDPPENVKMQYDCIVYSLSQVSQVYANNFTYTYSPGCLITIITRTPEAQARIVDELMKTFPYAGWDRAYMIDHLHHAVVSIYF